MTKKNSEKADMDELFEAEANDTDTDSSTDSSSENSNENSSKNSSKNSTDSSRNDSSSNDSISSDKSITFIKLEDDGKTEIKYVYHISDIHIRNTQRHTEYQEIFNRVYQKLRQCIGNNNKYSVIVVTGDIMHTKTELSPESFLMAQDLFKELNNIAPVFLIPGNHDCNLSNKNRMDALWPIVAGNVVFDNLYYLKKSGFYQYHNIVFGVTSIFDDVLIKANKLVPEIWQKIKQKNKYKIALYHGPVHGAKTDVGYRMNNEQLLAEDFEGYDYVMLGDIHKYQYMNQDKTIAYAGSLIQQSYGESLNGHGILKWDLLDQESELLEIKNDYGYCTIRIINGKMIETKIPRKPRIRFVLENTNQLQFQETLNVLQKQYQICEIIKESNFKTKLHAHNSPTQEKLNENVTAYETQEKIIRSYLAKKILDKDKIKNIIALHKNLYQKVLQEKKDQVGDVMHNAIKNQKWKLLELRFSNTLSYGKNNVIDFRKYDPNRIIGIVAPNHYGKSAILDIILFCLFDRCSRGERRDILNKNEKNMYCSLLFAIGNQKYLIERFGQRNKNGLTVKIDVDFYLIKEEKGKEYKEKLNGLDKNETNRKIAELIGDYNDYLVTCFCLQQGRSGNFIDMTQNQKKEYLNEILKLNVFENCYVLAKDKLKELSGELKVLEQKVSSKSLEEIKKRITEINEEITVAQLQKELLTKSLASMLEYIISSMSNLSLNQYHELSEYDLSTEEKIIQTIKKIKAKLSDIHIQNVDQLKIDLQNHKFELQKLEELMDSGPKKILDEYIQQKEMLLKQLVTIPKNYHQENLSQYLAEKNELQQRINELDQKLSQLKSINLSNKLDRINNLRKLIDYMRNNLKRVDASANNLEEIKSRLETNKQKLIKIFGSEHLQQHFLTIEEKKQLMAILDAKIEFSTHVDDNLSKLSAYQNGLSSENELNDAVIRDLIDINKKWLAKFHIWQDQTKNVLNQQESELHQIINESKELNRQLMTQSLNQINIYQNKILNDKIDLAQAELDSLQEFYSSQHEMENLQRDKKLSEEKLELVMYHIKNFEIYKQHTENNERALLEIDIVGEKINQSKKELENMENTKKELRQKIQFAEATILENKQQTKQQKKLSEHLELLEKYHIHYMDWKHKSSALKKWTDAKNKFDNDIMLMTNKIDQKKIELAMYKKELETYFQYRKEFDDKSAEINIYQVYTQVMNYNGLPYEMLKTYLPLIEADINQILHSMVNFSIEFMFYDENQLAEQKSKQLKSNIGCVDINICYQNMKPYNVQLASGFEKFIIGLAIRMTLCQISLTSKPNFLIIDEGWSCLDSDNLGNISSIMNYIKNQYEHVIIISHLEELRNQADYVINIEKNSNYSYIKTDQKLVVKRKKS